MSLSSCPLSRAITFGRQCSENKPNFSSTRIAVILDPPNANAAAQSSANPGTPPRNRDTRPYPAAPYSPDTTPARVNRSAVPRPAFPARRASISSSLSCRSTRRLRRSTFTRSPVRRIARFPPPPTPATHAESKDYPKSRSAARPRDTAASGNPCVTSSPGGVIFTTSADPGYPIGPVPRTTSMQCSSIFSDGSLMRRR